jgi:hypothetical protein
MISKEKSNFKREGVRESHVVVLIKMQRQTQHKVRTYRVSKVVRT